MTCSRLISAFGHLFELLFFSLLVTFHIVCDYVCVVNALIKGEIEDRMGPRTGGWSLPGVMSD